MIENYEHWRDANRATWSARWPNFSPQELACKGSNKLIVSHFFLDELQHLRYQIDGPIIITSGCRSLEYNHSIGGHSNSFHICDSDPLDRGQRGCLAVDVVAGGHYRGELFSLAWRNGWAVGWNDERGFLHLDQRVDVGWRQTTFGY